MDSRISAIMRAIDVYGETPTVSNRRQTATTLQGYTETGYVVGGRAYGGDYLGCIFPARQLAEAAIEEARTACLVERGRAAWLPAI
jgi:hypothetical protein